MNRTAAFIRVLFFGVILLVGSVPAYSEMLPYGTDVVVRIDRDIPMGMVRPGDIFTATIDQDVVSRGRVVVPRGERAEIRLVRTRDDLDEVAFHLHTITVNRHVYPVRSDTAREFATDKSGLSSAGKTLLGAAGGAALGGAIGGQKGALLGAAVGAGGGLVWAGSTRQNVKIPAGTPLLFTIREDVRLRR